MANYKILYPPYRYLLFRLTVLKRLRSHELWNNSDKQVSPWDGLILMKEILDRSGIREKIQFLHLPETTCNNSIDSLTVVESFFASVWIGATTFSQTAIVSLDDTLREMFGWERVPSGTTFGRFFKKFSWAENNRVFPALNQWFFEQIKPRSHYALCLDDSA